MRIHWLKLILGSVIAEIAAILLLVSLVAIFGPRDAETAQVYAEKLGRWVGPLAGGIFGFLGAVWLGRSLPGGEIVHGALFGLLLALVDTVLLFSMRAHFEWIFVVSNLGKVAAGVMGGLVAAHRRNPPSPNQAMQRTPKAFGVADPGSR
jgi:hypothetical protein